ncbi:MAG: S41 family peptidase [Dysgonamonadaceae bacterium]|nr:S41 family peptidase [Dysgonamonadaceae bacterium]MDD4728891.1 S41 family peptidase [Dysgonamonadaceae bacterium]
MNPEKRLRAWLPLIIALGIAIGIFIGNTYSIFNIGSAKTGSNKFDLVLKYINESYVDTIKMPVLLEDAIPSIVQGLDPHSRYFTSEEMLRLTEDLEGHFSGIGVEFFVQRDTIVVMGIINGGPSEAAGIKPGDRIITVNDSLVAGKNITNSGVVENLRGEKGSKVTLGIYRKPDPSLVEITVTRGDIPVNSVEAAYMVTEEIGLIKVVKFGGNTFNEFISALSKLKNQGCKSFVIDLRGNEGGYLEAATSMINEFLPKGDLIVYAEGRSFPRSDSYATGSGTCKTNDLVVLIDELSASSSEIFAGAIQDNDRGLVIGRRSFGKGLVQSQRVFKDGSAIRLTVARYYTASGRSIQRDYEKGKNAEYEMEAMYRYMQGDYVNSDTIDSTNMTQYKTVSGRTVYGGSGIMPDIFISRDSVAMNSYFNTLVNKGIVQEYAAYYTDLNRSKLDKFESSSELNQYLKKQPTLINLVSFADSKGVRRRPYLIQESRDLLESLLHGFIVRHFWGYDGYYPVYFESDNLVNKAVELLETGKASPTAIINEEYK